MTAFARILARCALAVVLAAVAAEAGAQDYPSRAVTIVVPHGNSTEKNAAMRALGVEPPIFAHVPMILGPLLVLAVFYLTREMTSNDKQAM